MISAFLDAVIFACPAKPSVDDVTGLIRCLLEWRDLSRAGWLKTFVSSTVSSCVARAGGGFPPWQAVTNAIQRLDIDVQPQDVYAIVRGMLERLPKIEEELGILDVLAEAPTCLPAFYENRQQVFQSDAERLLALICIYTERHGHPDYCPPAIFSRFLPGCPTAIDYTAQLVASDPDIPGLPRQIGTHAVVYECAAHFLAAVDPVDVWADSETNEICREAIGMYARRFAAAIGLAYSEQWSLGPSFARSVCALNLNHRQSAQRVLRACGETIMSQNMADTHMLRTTAGGNNAPVRRGRDIGWRRDIDAELHLHYWSTSQGPELACVVTHNDFNIPIR